MKALTIAVLALTVLSGLWAVMAKSLMRSVIGLAAASVCVTILMFRLGAGLAAVFELSVCAGLITVVFVSTVSMTQPRSEEEMHERKRTHLRRYMPLPFILLAIGTALAVFGPAPETAPPPLSLSSDAKEVLWNERQTDLLGQIAVILAGVFGVIALFKEHKE